MISSPPAHFRRCALTALSLQLILSVASGGACVFASDVVAPNAITTSTIETTAQRTAPAATVIDAPPQGVVSVGTADAKVEADTKTDASTAAAISTTTSAKSAEAAKSESASEPKAPVEETGESIQQVKPAAQNEVKVEAAQEVKPAAGVEVKVEAAQEVNPAASTQVKVEAAHEVKPAADTEVKVEASQESKSAAITDIKKVEAAPEIKAELKTDAKAGARSEPNAPVATTKELAMMSGEVGTSVALPKETADVGPIIIDNDEAVEMKETIEYKELPTDEGGTKVKAGATFPVVISSQITSKSATSGDPFEARLKYDLKIGDRLIAEKGSSVIGHVNYVLKARSAMHSLVSSERWYRNSGCVGIAFDEIVNGKGEHIPLVATPARAARIIKNKAEGRELGVNHNGQVTGPWSQQLRYKAIRIGINAAMAPAGVFSFGAMPVALGVIGAANPSFAFMKPVGQNVRHRRIKGFMWGALSGVPGSWIVEDSVVKGQEAVIKPGDEFLAEFKEEFTGEPQTEASLIPGASTKVKGQVVPPKKGKKQAP